MAERLQKLLAHAGIASRRAAETLIREGRVTVNGTVITELGSKADPRVDDVRVDGERLHAERRRVLLFHKPPAVVTTLSDPEGRPTVADYLPESMERVYPVGRLDFQSSGLLLLTNDGELAARLLHPRYRIARRYRVKVSGHPSETSLARLRRGVRLDDGVTGPAEVEVESKLPNKAWLRITIREGRNREIRRMCEAVGHLVDKLVRLGFGSIELGRLPPGRWRELQPDEQEALRGEVGLAASSRRPRRAAHSKPRAATPRDKGRIPLKAVAAERAIQSRESDSD